MLLSHAYLGQYYFVLVELTGNVLCFMKNSIAVMADAFLHHLTAQAQAILLHQLNPVASLNSIFIHTVMPQFLELRRSHRAVIFFSASSQVYRIGLSL